MPPVSYEANLLFKPSSAKYQHMGYDHTRRPHRAQYPTGWDKRGNHDDVRYVSQYVTEFSKYSTRNDMMAYQASADHKLNDNEANNIALVRFQRQAASQQNSDNNNDANILASILPDFQSGDGSKPDSNLDSFAMSLLPSSISGTTTATANNNGLNGSNSYINPQRTTRQQNPLLANTQPRVYVSGFPIGFSPVVLQEQLPTIFVQNLQRLNGYNPTTTPYTQQTVIRAVYAHDKFTFVEFAQVEDASAALSLNGLTVTLLNQGVPVTCTLVVKQPKDMHSYYLANPPVTYIHPDIANQPASSSHFTGNALSTNHNGTSLDLTTGSNGQPSANTEAFKLYLGNIALGASEADLRAFFQQIPGMIAFHINRSADGNKIFGFVSYDSFEHASLAIQQNNALQFAGRSLVVKFTEGSRQYLQTIGVSIPSNFGVGSGNPRNTDLSTSTYLSTSSSSHHISSGGAGNANFSMHPTLPAAADTSYIPTFSDLPTSYVCFSNVCSLQDFQAELDDILLDILSPIQAQTKILRIKYSTAAIPTNTALDVCLFFQCEDHLKASCVVTEFDKLQFGDNLLMVHFVEQSVFDNAQHDWVEPKE